MLNYIHSAKIIFSFALKYFPFRTESEVLFSFNFYFLLMILKSIPEELQALAVGLPEELDPRHQDCTVRPLIEKVIEKD